MKYFVIFSLIIIILNACTSPDFTETGMKVMEKFEEKYHCWRVNFATVIDNNSSNKPDIPIEIYECEGRLAFDSISEEDTVFFKNFAEELLKECKNMNKFNGIALTLHPDEESMHSKSFNFIINNANEIIFVDYYYYY
ncbi:MAG: hypothetical protein HY951_01455 [Bacteroidia bacterium]|nr:hypothetical protein [Bacteroidia bacterium]